MLGKIKRYFSYSQRGELQLNDESAVKVEPEKKVEPKLEKTRAEAVKVEVAILSGSTPVESSPVQQNKSKEKKKPKKQESNTALHTRKSFCQGCLLAGV